MSRIKQLFFKRERHLGWLPAEKIHPHLARVDEGAIAIASYPRSGNTWLRMLLADLVLQQAGNETATELPIHPDHIIPDIDRGDEWKFSRPDPGHLLYKTHWSWRPFMNRCVWLLRRPASALVSYYHFHQRYPERHAFANQGIDNFCKEYAGDWLEHTRSFLKRVRKARSQSLVMTYESLRQEPEVALMLVASFVGLNCSPEQIRTALDHHQLEKHQKREVSHSGDDGRSRFFRSGLIDEASSALQPDTYRWLERRLARSYRAASKLEPTALLRRSKP